MEESGHVYIRALNRKTKIKMGVEEYKRILNLHVKFVCSKLLQIINISNMILKHFIHFFF